MTRIEKAIKKQLDASREFLGMDPSQLIANKKQFDFRYLREATQELQDAAQEAGLIKTLTPDGE